MEWTKDRLARLSELWLAGTKTRLIAIDLGVTANAVIGRAHRDNLPRRENPVKMNGPRKPRPERPKLVKPPRIRVYVPKPKLVRRVVMEAPISKRVPLELVGLGQCRYITGPIRGRETEMCGHRVERGSWCGYHLGRVVQRKDVVEALPQ